MKIQPRQNILVKIWQRFLGRRAPKHDPLLLLSVTDFNFSSGWDRVVQKQRQTAA